MSAPEHIAQLLHNLNSPNGPNLRGIANNKYTKQLPQDWRLSFGRVSPQALTANAHFYERLERTFREFETACARIIEHDYGLAEHYIGKGIAAPDHTAQIYRTWQTPFSARRLDVIIGEDGPVISENDEMPGGLIHAYWLDYCYGVNQARWEFALEWLCQYGAVAFAVSELWSAPYVTEFQWFVDHLRARGANVFLLTERDMRNVYEHGNQLYYGNTPIATVWRQFPIFEGHGDFEPLVRAAQRGMLRMAPEFASWGNKAWFAAFWQHKSVFRALMSTPSFELLQRVLPPSAQFVGNEQFPIGLPYRDAKPWQMFDSLDDLCKQPTGVIKELVAKSAGAHDEAARSYGVVIGRSLTVRKWGEALTNLAFASKSGSQSPTVLQRFAKPGVNTLPMVSVLNSEATFEPEFKSYMLVRPWFIGGQLISAVALVQGVTSVKLHGVTTGCEAPIDLG